MSPIRVKDDALIETFLFYLLFFISSDMGKGKMDFTRWEGKKKEKKEKKRKQFVLTP